MTHMPSFIYFCYYPMMAIYEINYLVFGVW